MVEYADSGLAFWNGGTAGRLRPFAVLRLSTDSGCGSGRDEDAFDTVLGCGMAFRTVPTGASAISALSTHSPRARRYRTVRARV